LKNAVLIPPQYKRIFKAFFDKKVYFCLKIRKNKA
jgi:hypothetical protein